MWKLGWMVRSTWPCWGDTETGKSTLTSSLLQAMILNFAKFLLNLYSFMLMYLFSLSRHIQFGWSWLQMVHNYLPNKHIQWTQRKGACSWTRLPIIFSSSARDEERSLKQTVYSKTLLFFTSHGHSFPARLAKTSWPRWGDNAESKTRRWHVCDCEGVHLIHKHSPTAFTRIEVRTPSLLSTYDWSTPGAVLP